MPKRLPAHVSYETLQYATKVITVDSPEWLEWVEMHINFSYFDDNGQLTVRYEQEKYWRAYRLCGKKTRKQYLSTVTLASLQQASQALVCSEDDKPTWEQNNPDNYFPDHATITAARTILNTLENKEHWSKGDCKQVLQIANAALFELGVKLRTGNK
jgi:hypothetical protein